MAVDAATLNARVNARLAARKAQQGPKPPPPDDYHADASALGNTVARLAQPHPIENALAIAKASAKTVSVAAEPVIAGIQAAGIGNEQAKVNLYDAVKHYREAVEKGGPKAALTQAPRAAWELASAIPKGAAAVIPKFRPQYPDAIHPANAFAETIERDYPGFNVLHSLPHPVKMALLNAALALGGPGHAKDLVKALGAAGGPQGVSIASDIPVGEAMTKMAQGAGAAGKAVARVPAVAQFLEGASDAVRARFAPLMHQVSPLGEYKTSVRNPLRLLWRERHADQGAETQRLSALVAGDQDVIRAGAKEFGVSPVERGQYLTQVYEKAPHENFAAGEYLDKLVQSNKITQAERDLLLDSGPAGNRKGYAELFEEAVPAARGGSSLNRTTLYESSYRAASRARDAMNRADNLYRELEAMRSNNYIKGTDLAGGDFSFGKSMSPKIDEKRKELARALVDVNNQIRAFSKVSRHPLKPLDLDERNLFRYTSDELMGKINKERGLTEVFKPGTRDPAFAPEKLPYRAVTRLGTNGVPETRVFNKFGKQLESIQGDDALDVAKRKYGGSRVRNPGVQSFLEQSAKAQGQVPSQGELEYLDQLDQRWGRTQHEKPYSGPKGVNISELRARRLELQDAQERFARYLPRYRSEELTDRIEKMGLSQEYGSQPAIKTSMGGKRATKPTMTTSDLRSVLKRRFASKHQVQIEEPLQDITQAARTHIALNSKAIANSRFIQKVAQHFGETLPEAPKEIPPGYAVLGDAKGFTTGMTPGAKEILKRTLVPEDVMRAVKDLDQIIAPSTRRGISDLFHKALMYEKQYLTVVNPQFTIRNQVWNVMSSYMRGNHNPANWRDAFRAMEGGRWEKVPVPGLRLTYGDLRREMLNQGVIGGDLGFSTELGSLGREKGLAGGGLSSKLGAPVQALKQVNQEGEGTARAAHFIWGLRDQKMTSVAARAEVAKTLFDYSRDFYTVSEAHLREVIPFYAWYRRILPLALRTAFERPGEYAKLGSIMNNVNAMNGVSPEEVELLGRSYMDAIGVVLPDSKNQPPGTKRVLSMKGVGLVDPGSFLQGPQEGHDSVLGWFLGPAQGLGQALRPDVQLIGSMLHEGAIGGRKYDGKPAKLPQAVGFIPKPIRARLHIGRQIGEGPNDGEAIDGQFYGPSYLIPLLSFLAGSAGNGLASNFSSNPRVRAKFRAWATALSIDPEVPFEENRTKKDLQEYGRVKAIPGNLRREAIMKGSAEADSVMRTISPEERRILEMMHMGGATP